MVVTVYGTRSINVRVLHRGQTWRRHVDQLRPHFGADQDKDPGDNPAKTTSAQFDRPPMDSPRIQVPPNSNYCDAETGGSPMTTSTEYIIRDDRSDSKTRDTGAYFGIS